jgi:hypothetical protein
MVSDIGADHAPRGGEGRKRLPLLHTGDRRRGVGIFTVVIAEPATDLARGHAHTASYRKPTGDRAPELQAKDHEVWVPAYHRYSFDDTRSVAPRLLLARYLHRWRRPHSTLVRATASLNATAPHAPRSGDNTPSPCIWRYHGAEFPSSKPCGMVSPSMAG